MEGNHYSALPLWLLIPLLVLLSRATATDGQAPPKGPLIPMDAGEMAEMGLPVLPRDVKVKFQGKDYKEPWILASSDTDLPSHSDPLLAPAPSAAVDDAKDGIEDMFNMKVIRFMTDKPTSIDTTTGQPTPVAIRAMRARRSDDGASTLAGTAPPEVTLPDTIKQIKEKYEAETLLGRLANEKTRQAKPPASPAVSPSIRGGNAGKKVVDFDEAIRVTIPYGDERTE